MRKQNGKIRFLGGAMLSLLVFASVSFAQSANQPPAEPTENAEAKIEKPAPRPPFRPLRFEEDHGFLRDESRRTEPFDRLKYIPLRGDREDWYVSIGGEIRPFYEFYDNNDFGRGAQDSSGYLLQRLMLHADFRFGQKVRVFAQIKSGIVADKSSPVVPPDVNKADINALFVDFNFGVRKASKDGGGQTNSFGYLAPRVTLRVGRQELNFGAGRIVSVRNGPNVRQAHDGVSVIWRAEKWRVDAVLTKPVEDDRGYFDDQARNDQTFWGVHASRPFALLSKTGKIDVYYFGFDRKRARFNQGAARDSRHTFGARFYNVGKRFDYDVEFAAQAGRFGDGDIRAWTIAPSVGYTFVNTKFKPRVGLDAGIVSGDRDPRDKDLQTFAPPFPRGQYFGLIGANGAYNIQGFRPSLKLNLTEQISVTASNFFFWRQSRADGLYNVPGVLIRNGNASRALYIGASPEIEMTWQINRYSTLQIGASKFFAGRFLRETPPARNIGYVMARYTFLF